jgi:hypothetical protein
MEENVDLYSSLSERNGFHGTYIDLEAMAVVLETQIKLYSYSVAYGLNCSSHGSGSGPSISIFYSGTGDIGHYYAIVTSSDLTALLGVEYHPDTIRFALATSINTPSSIKNGDYEFEVKVSGHGQFMWLDSPTNNTVPGNFFMFVNRKDDIVEVARVMYILDRSLAPTRWNRKELADRNVLVMSPILHDIPFTRLKPLLRRCADLSKPYKSTFSHFEGTQRCGLAYELGAEFHAYWILYLQSLTSSNYRLPIATMEPVYFEV